MNADERTIFKKIIDREISADIVYEDEHCLAFRDIAPQAPTHVLLIPKRELRSMDDVTDSERELLGHMMAVISQLARDLGISEGYRVVTNCGAGAGQEVNHLHFHILAGRKMQWPPG